jgi:hypothetical protein
LSSRPADLRLAPSPEIPDASRRSTWRFLSLQGRREICPRTTVTNPTRSTRSIFSRCIHSLLWSLGPTPPAPTAPTACRRTARPAPALGRCFILVQAI